MRNDQKISIELKSIANNVKERLQNITQSDDYQFSIVIFNPIEGERLNYISNCDRADVIHVWETLIKAWDNGMPDIKTHDIN